MARRWALAAAVTLTEAVRWALAAELGASPDLVALLQHSVGSGRSRALEAPVVQGPPPVYLLGDGAEVFIETGQYENTWVPCTITKLNVNGWYDIRLPAGVKGKNSTDVGSIRFNYLRQVTPEVYDKSLEDFMANPEKVALVAQVDRESHRRMRASAALKRSRDYAKEVMSKGCPGEYIITDGNIPHGDHFGRGSKNLQSSVELCASDCDKYEECKAFEWDPVSTICQLKKRAEPKPDYSDSRYMLCQKFVYEAPSNQTSPAAEAESKPVEAAVQPVGAASEPAAAEPAPDAAKA